MREDIKNRINNLAQNEIPFGYLKSKGCLYPDDWQYKKLSSELSENRQRNYDGQFSKEDVLSVSGDHGVINQIELLGRSYAGESVDNYHVVNTGDIVYTKSPLKANPYGIIKLNLGKAGIVSTLYAVYHCRDDVVGKYLNFYFQMDMFLNNYLYPLVKKGAKNDMKVNNEDVLTGKIAFPPIREQQRIVDLLAQCDKVIELKQQLIEEERNRKKWLMQNLLDPDSGIRLPGFDDKWSKSTMGELFEFGSSLSASRADLSNNGTCYLHYGDIHGNSTGIVDIAADYEAIPKIDSFNSKVKMLNHGDVVFVDASEDYEGASKYVVVVNPDNIPFLPGLHTIPAKSRSDALDVDFKKYCFQSYAFRKQVAFYVSGMKVFGLNKKNFAKISLIYPGIEEQRAIAKLLLLSDKVISNMEQELAQWQQKKKALMQLLLTGIVRVSV